MNSKITLLLLFFGSYWLPLQGQSTIQNAINTLAKDVSLRNAGLSISVINVKTGQLVGSHNAHRSLIPASSLKVVTTATALALLGESYTFKTELQYDGSISNGTLNGNLYIKGYGDPTLGSDQLEGTPDLPNIMSQFRQAIQKTGIRQVNGAVVGDGSYFSSNVNPSSWQWNDLGNYYGAGVFGLNIHENLYYLRFQQKANLGAKPGIAQIEPHIPNLMIYNEVKSAGRRTGDNAYIYGGPFTYTRTIRGTIPVGSGRFSIKGSIPNPPYFAAYELNETLKSNGLSVSNVPTTSFALEQENLFSKSNRKTIFTHRSPQLKTIVKRTNIKSVNLYAETLLKAIGAEKGGNGTRKAGVETLEGFWRQRGLDLYGFFMEDGSGLSARNAMSSYHLAKIMQITAKDDGIFDTFYDSLPVGGQSGSLRSMFRGTAGYGNVRAKSGTLKRVRSFTGYATSKSGELLAFSIIVNNYMGSGGVLRKKLEKVMLAMCL